MIIIARYEKETYRKVVIESFKRKGIKYFLFRLTHIGSKITILKRNI